MIPYANPDPNALRCPGCGRYQYARRAGWTDADHAYVLWGCCNYTQLFSLTNGQEKCKVSQ